MLIFVSDLDGTLIKDNCIIAQKNLDMMRKLQELGHLVVLCTGRSLKEFQVIQKDIQFPCDYIILNNGALIVDKHYQKLYEKVIPHDIGVSLLRHISHYPQLSSMFSDGENTYGFVDGKTVDYGQNGEVIAEDYQDLYLQAKHFAIIAFHQSNMETTYTKQCYDDIFNQYSNDVEAYGNTHFVDVVPKGCSKGNGVRMLLKLLNQEGEIWAIGDSHNDLSMLKDADYGYTFDYAQDIKEQISYQVHYVYEMIEAMLEKESK